MFRAVAVIRLLVQGQGNVNLKDHVHYSEKSSGCISSLTSLLHLLTPYHFVASSFFYSIFYFPISMLVELKKLSEVH